MIIWIDKGDYNMASMGLLDYYEAKMDEMCVGMNILHQQVLG